MRTEFDRVVVTANGAVAVVTLNHPEVMNAMSARMLAGAAEALDFVADAERGFRAMVFTGEGKSFCSGANLADGPVEGATDIPSNIGIRMERYYHPLLRRLRDLPMPVVTAVNGPAVGIGMSFALMGDIAIAARSAYFLQAFAKIGLIPDGGATFMVPRLIGLARARELSFLAEKLPAEKALEWGLINRVTDDETLMDEALALAGRLADGPTAAFAAMRRLYLASPENGYEAQLELERHHQMASGATDDFKEGVTAFLHKRQPVFQGK